MLPKSILVMLSVCVALHPGKTNADTSIILQDFEEIIFDFFERYSNNTADDICKASVPEIIINKESFEKSQFYKLTGHSKCEEKQCAAVDYELRERREVKIEKRIPEEDKSTYTTKSIENEETTAVTDTSTGNEKTTLVTDTSTGNEETTQVTDTSTANEETTQVTDTSTGNEETTTTESEHRTAENSKWEKNNGTTSHSGKKTTVIVVSTMAAVATTAAAAVYGVPWIKAILQSGVYRFPATPGV